MSEGLLDFCKFYISSFNATVHLQNFRHQKRPPPLYQADRVWHGLENKTYSFQGNGE